MIRILLFLCATLISVVNEAIAQNVTIDLLRYSLYSGTGEATVLGLATGVKDLDELTIPEYVKYEDVAYSVTKIGTDAFKNKTVISGKLTLPSSIKEIGESAFYNCVNLTGELDIPSNVSVIGDHTFSGCTGFTGVLVLPENIELKSCAFAGCTGFSGLVLPESMTTSGHTFWGCTGMKGDLKLPGSVPVWWAQTFADTGFSSITIGEGTTRIVSSCFSGCTNLKEISLPSTLSLVGRGAFYNCKSLNTIICHALTPPDHDRQDRYPYYQQDMNLPVTAFTNGAYSASSSSFPYNSAELMVPMESADKYKKAFEWKAFKTITGFSSEITAVIVPESISMKVGETETIEYQIIPDSAIDKTVTWTSSDNGVATVDAEGTVTALAAGSTIITVATVNGLTATCTVTVTEITTKVDEIADETADDNCYDFQGRLIPGQPKRGSIVVRNGKKIIVK